MQDGEVKNENTMSTVEGDANSRVYELGYLLVPTIAEEDIATIFSHLRELILSLEGVMISDDMPRMINLAYSMSKVITNVRTKFNTGYFGWVKFTMDADRVLELKKKLDLDGNFLRFLILKTVKENTIAAKRFVHRDVPYRKPPGVGAKKEVENEVPVEINKEEIDKEIDAMVAV